MSSGSPPAAPGVRPLHVLVIDDSAADLELTRVAMETIDPSVQVTTAMSWTELPVALGTAWPDLIIVDAHMPGMDGFAVVSHLKSDPALRVIPVVVRSGSDSPTDISRAYEAHANAFILKPSSFEELVEQLHALLGFWHFNRTLSGLDVRST